MLSLCAVVYFAASSVAAPATPQEADRWAGRKVIVNSGAVLKVGDQVIEPNKPLGASRGDGRSVFRVFTIERTNGGWYWLVSNSDGVRGWAKSTDVLTIEQALETYTIQVRLYPTNKQLRMFRAILWLENNQGSLAIADYDEVIRDDPNDVSAYIARGDAWQKQNEPDKAIADYGEAIRRNPRSVSAYTNRGNAWYVKADDNKAIADYNEAIRLDPNEERAYLGRGNLWYIQREYAKALADYNAVIGLDPNIATAYHNRGDVLRATKAYEKAIADYGEAIRLDPKYAKAYHARAAIWAACPDPQLRNGKRAVESATRACELSDWVVAEYLATLAAAYAETSDFAKAVRWQQKAVDMSRNKTEKQTRLAHLARYKSKMQDRDVSPNR